MTTTQQPSTTRPTDSWTIEEHRAERARNKAYWEATGAELRGRFPDRWIVVYGGDTAVAYQSGKDLIEHLNTLDHFTRCAMLWAWPPPRASRVRFIDTRD